MTDVEINTTLFSKWLEDCKSLTIASPDEILSAFLSLFGKYFGLVQGIAFTKNDNYFEQVASYAFISEEKILFEEGDGITGQAVKDKQILVISDISEKYFTAVSGLGKSKKLQLIILPLIKDDTVEAVLEMAFFKLPEYELKENTNTISKCYFEKLKNK